MTNRSKSRALYELDTVDRNEARFFTGDFKVDTDTWYEMRRADWEDFGRPLTITVTIEPGDTLNT